MGTLLNHNKKAHHQAALLSLMGLTHYVKKEEITEPIMPYQDRMQDVPNELGGSGEQTSLRTETMQQGMDGAYPAKNINSQNPSIDQKIEQKADSMVSPNAKPYAQSPSTEPVNAQNLGTQDANHHPYDRANLAQDGNIAQKINKLEKNPQRVGHDTTQAISEDDFKLPTTLPTGGTVVVKANRFLWFGVAYRHFILIGDGQFLNTATKGVWQSLTNRLSEQSGQSPSEVKFPFGDFDRFGQMAAMGFLTKLENAVLHYLEQGGCHQRPTYLFLTPMRESVSLDVHAVPCPSLDDMARFREAKMDFWQLLHRE